LVIDTDRELLVWLRLWETELLDLVWETEEEDFVCDRLEELDLDWLRLLLEETDAASRSTHSIPVRSSHSIPVRSPHL